MSSCVISLEQSSLKTLSVCLEQLTPRLSTLDWLALDPGRGVLSQTDLLKTFIYLGLKLWNVVKYSENLKG